MRTSFLGWLWPGSFVPRARRRRTREWPRCLQLEPLEHRELLATVPAGFTEEVVAAGISSATAMEIAPGGDLWVLEQGGRVKRFAPGSTTADIVGSVSPLGLSSSGERGLLGIAFDPDYATTGHIFLYYTATSPNTHNRISRFTVQSTDGGTDYFLAGTSTTGDAGTTGTPTQTIIFELDALSGATNHNGGAIHFGPDGMLYAAVGDNATSTNSQTLANLHGKMLRISKDGTIPTDNPFFTQATGDERAIWALGLRNPFTFTFQPGSGRMFINDVGQNAWEEINDGLAGSNYMWPENEGNGTNPTAGPGTDRQPFYAYSHGGGTFQGFAITGGAFYNPLAGQFPPEFAGDYFFADFVNDWINVIDTSTKAVTRFATGALGTVDLRVAADGSLVYLARDSNSAFRVRYTAGTAPNITQEPASATVPESGTASFTVAASGTPPLTYQWQKLASAVWTDLADVGRISGAAAPTLSIASVQLSDAGEYRAVVTNSAGSDTSAAATLTVTANQPPTGTITIDSGLTNGKFIAGQAIGFSGTANDPEEGPLAASRFTWQVDYITSIDSGNPAVRPFVAPFSGQTSGSFTPAASGPYTLADVKYRVTLSIEDSGGLSSTTTIEVLPNVSTLTVTTSPAGLQVTVDGQPFTAPHSFDSVAGFERPIGAAASQTLGGTTYTFAAWSDGGAATHTLSTPLSDTTYTAAYEAVPAAFTTARINFQTTDSQGFSGYAADTGLAFGNRGNGLTYGWNGDNTAAARNRNSPLSPDERYDTLIHLQNPSLAGSRFEIAAPSGTYRVRVVAGDPSQTNSYFRINVEGVRAITGRPTTARRWFDNTIEVFVSDGRLTVESAKSARNNKLAFLEVTFIPPGTIFEPPFDAEAAVELSSAVVNAETIASASPAAAGRDTMRSAYWEALRGMRTQRSLRLSDRRSSPPRENGEGIDPGKPFPDEFQAALDSFFASLDAD